MQNLFYKRMFIVILIDLIVEYLLLRFVISFMKG